MNTKRTLTAMLLFALALFLSVETASAQTVGKAKNAATAKQAQNGISGTHYVDANGDGICDYDADQDGIPNRLDADYTRPMDGTGKQYGKANNAGTGSANGTGVCDGTGPKGNAKRGKK